MRVPKGGVAFFDSGIGGLTVLAECVRRLPSTVFLYYGDNRRAPYGNLSPKKIRRYVLRAFKKFKRWRVRAAVVACNTATALCVEELRKKFPFPIVGAEPAVLAAAKGGGDIFVLSTRATYESERFRALCQRAEAAYPSARLFPFPCDGLAGEIEAHLLEEGRSYEDFLPRGKPSCVVLGCTHYVYVAEQIRSFYGCPTMDGNGGIASRLSAMLKGEIPARPPLTTKGKNCPPKAFAENPFQAPKKKKRLPQRFPLKNAAFAGNQSRIFFLGSSKMVNETVFKQMFGLKVVFRGQKSQNFQKKSKKISKNP